MTPDQEGRTMETDRTEQLFMMIFLVLVGTGFGILFIIDALIYPLSANYVLVIGGALLYLLVSGILRLNHEISFRARINGTMTFPKDEVDSIRYGVKTLSIRVWKNRRIGIGTVYNAKVADVAEPFARLRIVDVRRTTLGELSPEDIQQAGGYSPEDFRRRWIRRHGKWESGRVVRIIRFKTRRRMR